MHTLSSPPHTPLHTFTVTTPTPTPTHSPLHTDAVLGRVVHTGRGMLAEGASAHSSLHTPLLMSTHSWYVGPYTVPLSSHRGKRYWQRNLWEAAWQVTSAFSSAMTTEACCSWDGTSTEELIITAPPPVQAWRGTRHAPLV